MKAHDKPLTGTERRMDPSELIVTKTDPDGKIHYGNRTFFKYAGYTERECLGVQHNIVRHPEMPRTIFKLMWDTIQAGREIFAYVNNRAKNGDHYWVLAHVTPSFDSNGQIVAYHSNRRAPNERALKDVVIPLYRDLLGIERAAGSPKQGLEAGERHIKTMLAERGVGLNQMIFEMGT